ncbi:hypothetical protein GCM10022395_14570 [Snuella lapsa]|uniref:Uncharacterized protein n=1 Tax=Snuella lapsa TaxID=870481 RepID=A0ABP6XF10_9FLAO
MSPWINGLKIMPRSPLADNGYIPYLLKLKPKRTSNQNTIQIISMKSTGYTTTPVENLKCSLFSIT